MPKTRIILQSRLSSQRLPGKALLPIAEVPAILLAAQRAANTGHPVVVAISTHHTDDLLEDTLRLRGLDVVRGCLDDVLARFVFATRDLADDDIVVRLTADNVFPDGSFIDQLLHEQKRWGGYVAPDKWVPCGLNAEAFTVGALRLADKYATVSSDREHVTPYILRHEQMHTWRPVGINRDLSHLRSAVGTLADYKLITTLFRDVSDPIRIGYQELLSKLAAAPGVPQLGVRRRTWPDGVAHSELALGTVQLGLNYGAANSTGQPTFDESAMIVETAIKHGVTAIDTARAYGSSESRLGTILASGLSAQVTTITKLSPLTELSADATTSELCQAVDASVFRSCRELRFRQLPVLLLHRWNHYSRAGGVVWRRLLELQKEGVIDRLGASVTSPDEALEASRVPAIMHIQLPMNILDYRWEEAGVPEVLARRPELVVHARSSLLQGIIGANPERWPSTISPCSFIEGLDNAVHALGRKDRIDLAFAYVRSLPWVTSVLLGIETLSQLHDGLERFLTPPLTAVERAKVRSMIPRAPVELLDPSLWPRVLPPK